MLQPHTVTVDTLAAVEALRKGNKFTKEQAKAIVDTIRSVELYGVATSTDVQRIEKAILKLDKSTSEDIQKVRSELKNEIHSFRAEIFKWGGTLIAGLYAMVIGMLLKLFGAL